MFEILGSGLLGSIFGGLFRLAPEIIKFLDRKNERMHEYKMFGLQTDLEKVRGEFKVEGKYVDHSIAQIDAIGKAFEQQSKDATASYPWVAAASAMVRPGVTYVLFLFYIIFKFLMIATAMTQDVAWESIMAIIWTSEDFGMLSMILTFWFVGRAIEKYQKTV